MMQEEIIHSLTQWINQNLGKHLSIDEVAAKSGYSKWHLQRMFRAVTQQTLGDYIRERRLEMAADALCKTRRPVFDIALQYGYESQQTFSRVFRRQFDQTPTAYRQAMRCREINPSETIHRDSRATTARPVPVSGMM